MRPSPILSAVLLTAATPVVALLTAATPVVAQVTVDLHALQALPNRPTTEHAPFVPQPRTAPASLPRATSASTEPNRPGAVTPTAPASAPAAPPVIPENVPNTASIAPVAPPVAAPGAAPVAPPPISDKATTAAAPIAAGLRVTFAPGDANLSPESDASIKQLAKAAPPGDATTFNVLAYAPGKADDPSTARRISLSRAMAVRSALVADGVPSARIFVRALGERFGDGPPDRVDLSVSGTNPPGDTATAK